MKDLSNSPDFKIMRPKEVCDKLNIGMSTLYRWMEKGILPPKLKVGSNYVGFRSDQIDEFINEITENQEQAAA